MTLHFGARFSFKILYFRVGAGARADFGLTSRLRPKTPEPAALAPATLLKILSRALKTSLGRSETYLWSSETYMLRSETYLVHTETNVGAQKPI